MGRVSAIEPAKIAEEVKQAERRTRDRDRNRFRRDTGPTGSANWNVKRARMEEPEHKIRDCSRRPAQAHVVEQRAVQPAQPGRGGPPLSRGRGQGRGGNSHGRGAPDRGTVNTKAHVGSTHSYVSCDISRALGVHFEETVCGVTVISPLDHSVKVEKLFRELPLETQGRISCADLMELPLEEFDLILGMDWLTRYRATLDYAAKRMVLRTIEDKEELMRKGCEVYLVFVNQVETGDLNVDTIRTVREFRDVFPEELLGLPPNREVEFGIDLLPGIAPELEWVLEKLRQF
ncbi:uncharacterized protein [Gossypium hirsutum]|uniref:Uncharacterized protein n=1 Tax=Gossypium hirsutum TaxID=3635 RepID=A0ABM2ZVA0_GOSHI|nr:uncharacterized protein LOC121215622 [Gossypium hirsutum]